MEMLIKEMEERDDEDDYDDEKESDNISESETGKDKAILVKESKLPSLENYLKSEDNKDTVIQQTKGINSKDITRESLNSQISSRPKSSASNTSKRSSGSDKIKQSKSTVSQKKSQRSRKVAIKETPIYITG